MKKIIIVLTTVLFSLNGYAQQDKPITVKELPTKAQQFMRQYFPNDKPSFAKSEREFFETRYEVVLTNSTKIEFFKNGEWKEVDCRYSAVPAAIVPEKIRTKTNEMYPEATIVRIDRENRNYEIKLNNGVELEFNASMNLIDIDN